MVEIVENITIMGTIAKTILSNKADAVHVLYAKLGSSNLAIYMGPMGHVGQEITV